MNRIYTSIPDVYGIEAFIAARMVSNKDVYDSIETPAGIFSGAFTIIAKCIACFVDKENFIADVRLDGKANAFLSVDFENMKVGVEVYNAHGHDCSEVLKEIAGACI